MNKRNQMMNNILSLNKKKTTIKYFLDLLKIPNTEFGLNEKIKFQPNANSLMGISDILHEYRVDNISARVSLADLAKIDTPFIAQIETPVKEFVIVTELQDGWISYLKGSGDAIREAMDVFGRKWSGIVLMAETNEKSREENFDRNLRMEILGRIRLPFILSVLGVFLFYFGHETILLSGAYRITSFLLGFLFLSGTIVSVFLLTQLVDRNNVLVKRICNLNKASNCNSVLESQAAKFLGILSWSELGFVYFAGNLLSLIFIPNVQLLVTLNVCTLPYTFWSIYYQWKIAKQWCMLCVSVQGLLWGIFLVNLLSVENFQLYSVSGKVLIETLFCFLIPVVILWFVLPFIRKSMQLPVVLRDLNSIKANELIFKAALSTQKATEIAGDDALIFSGNPDAPFVVTLITNPYCGPCATTHEKLNELQKKYGDFIRIQTIYAGSADMENDRNKAIKTLIAVYLQHEPEKVEDIYAEWYDTGKSNIDAFSTKYSIKLNDNRVGDIFASHLMWCENAGIIGTPTIYINEHELPGWYGIEDLKYFIKY